ncbi:Ig-like domain-containing protein [Aliarcobacter cryaerophilus]|uniref:Calx-beta domain-containing protein n=1 Tax=Aliarcobacter cryaerophilus TaxID=28198 RepID=UPI0021B1B9EB|nr:Calx-beta domain-containing protein [Aliarcobacter cryaerophilus]MCT7504593.1 Ig-like domain-containing protein [Aliarcobacter cryaerophilus]
MASKVGIVESINDGKFFAKDSLGNTKELKNGDIIYENDVVFSDGSNSSNSEIRVALEGEDIIVLKNGVQQLFDSSLIASTFGDEEVVFTRKGLEALLQQAGDMTNVETDLRWASFDNYVDITEEETTAGEEEEEVLEEGSIGQFALRDGALVDVISDLRAKSWVRTQNYKEVENSEYLERTSLKPLGGSPNISVSIPRPIAPNPIDTIIPIAPTPETPIITEATPPTITPPTITPPTITPPTITPPTITPPTITPPTITPPTITPIANLSIDDITMYEQDGFMVFTVTLDIPASGNITVNFTTSNGTAESGKDYTPITGIITIPSGSSTAQIRIPINDDYYYEKSETFNVTLTNPTGNVNIVKPVGVGTILDNPPANNKPLDPNKPDSETGIYGEEDSVYAIITGSTTVKEGDKANYTVQIIDKDGNPVVVDKNTDVTVVYKNISTQDNDTQYKNGDKITVTIPKGSSEVKFEVQTKDDFYADNGENFNLSIEKVDTNEFENVVIGDKNGNNKNVTTTILDNPSTTEQPTIPTDPSNPNNPDDGISYGQEDTVYAIITGAITVNEGNTTTYTVKLVDKDGNTVVVTNPTTVTVKYTNVTTQDGDTQFNNNNTINVTIPANGSSNTFTVESIDDYFADNGEKYNVAITKVDTNEFENVVIGDKNGKNKNVTTTILDDTDNTPNNPNDGVESNHESVIIKLVACDASGNPILEADGKTYKIVNEVNEGDNAKYMALAFEPNSTTFTTETKLSLQGGTVTVDTSNGTAVGVTTQTKEDGSEDFILVKDKVVNIGVAFEVVTVDDYISDNNEIYTVSINSGSYTHPTTPIYENVTINNEAVSTTIKDNSNPVDNTTPHNPNDPTNHNQESDKEIVLIKLFAADENGNVIKDGNGNYLLANEAEEGTNANYIAYAFENGTTIFNDYTKISVQTGSVDISFQNDTATGTSTKTLTDGSQDFNNTQKTSVSIGQSFSTEVFRDLASESTEKYKVVIDSNSYSGNYESVNIDTTAVTTTIHDEKLFVKIEQITDVANEGANLKYKVVIVNKDGEEVKVPTGKTLTVNLSYEGNTSKEATDGDDYTKVSTVTIMGGNSSQEFEVSTKDDYYAEGDEGLKITITGTNNATTEAFENLATHTEANGAPSDKITTTGTIKDNPAKIDQPDTSTGTDNPTNGSYGQEDTVYAIITGTQTIKEGDISTDYTVELVDKAGSPVTVTNNTQVTIKFEGTSSNQASLDDIKQFLDLSENNISIDAQGNIKVTIPANSSEVKFKVQTKDDVYKDDGEQFNLTITNIQNTGEFENIKIGDKDGNQKNVITTIEDNTTTGTETNVDPVSIVLVALEKGQTLADITDADGKLIYTNTNTTPESGKLYYVAVAVDSENKVLVQSGKVTVNTVDITGGAKGSISTTPKIDGSEDYKSLVNQSVNIGEVFEVQTNDDYVRDNNETFTVKITNVVDTNYESPSIDTAKNTVTSTITDNPAQDTENPNTPTEPTDPNNPNDTTKKYGEEDTVYVKITKTPSTIEGGDLVHTVTLVDKNGDPVTVPAGQSVTVTLEYTAKSSTGTGTFTAGDLSTTVKTVTIDGGTNHKDFTNISIDDFTAEGDEVYTVTITDVSQTGAFENVAISSTNSTTGTIKDGVILGDPVNAKVYEDGLNTSATTENDLGKSLGITNPNADTYTVSFDKTITTTDKTSNGKAITYSYNTDGTILTATRAGDNKIVFTVELKKDGSGNDVYDFKLIEPMDHDYGNNGKNQFAMPFEFNVTSNGTTSSNKTFNVTVVDSVPSADAITANTKEDTAVIVRLADDDFKADEKVTINGTAHNIGATGIAIYEKGDTTKQIGSLTINTNGTVTFTPIEDYSNHDTTKSPEFTYTVKDFDGDEATSTVTINVKPVADAPGITTSSPTMTEDDGNTKEGTHQVSLGLTKPSLSKDQTDKNSAAGDHPERNGEITLTFTNGDKVTGAKIFKADGTTQIGSDITTANQTLKIVIVTVSGDSNTIDYNYHHADITASNPSGANVVYLTQAEYEGLKIQHAEDNDTDIRINIKVTSYEVDDTNTPLDTATYGNQVENEASANMTVKIHPETDDISLIWDTAIGGIISQVDNTGTGGNNNVSNTFTFTSKNEGDLFTTPIDLKSLLTKTSGTETFDGSKADLDGSEKRTYKIEGIPEGTIVTLGGQAAVANASGVATIVFNNTNNQAADPEFSLKLPEHYSGTISNAKITLSVQDKGVDSGDTAGETKTAEVYFNVVVNPIADIATIQVSQSVGFEDAGRDGGNTIAKSDTINANGAGGIPLNIKVSSDDKDGSESFNVKIEDIPSNAVIYYDGMVVNQSPAGTVTINNFDNAKSLIFIPPHNDDTDYTLKVSAQTVDNNGTTTNTSAWSSTKDIEVIVKNVADAPVGTTLKENIKVDEDNKLNLQNIYTTSANLASYDGSEELTVKIDLPAGFTVDSGSPYYVENGMYVVKASDIKDGKILINVPENFSGSASFDLTYVTTEKAGENDSKTWDKQTVNIFVNPIADDVSVATSSTIYEDADGNANKINIAPSLTDTDGSETITMVKILASDVPARYELYLDSAMTQSISSTLIGGYYILTPEQADSIYAKNTITNEADKSDNFNLTVVYTVKDTASGTSDVTADFTHTHTVNVQAVTDAPSLNIGTIAQESGNVTVNGTTVTVNQEDSQFKVPVTTTSSDTDGSETVQKIVITGVPMGVEVVGATYYGYSGSIHNGIWVITPSGDDATKLDLNGALEDITFKVNQGANFDYRDITITTYTKDIDAEVKSAYQTIHIERTYPDGVNPGTPADLDLTVQAASITEDTEFNLANLLEVNLKSGGTQGNGGAVITISDIPEGSTITGYDYSYEDGGKTYYVVVGNGNAADMNTQLSNVKITTPKDVNSSQEGTLKGDFTFTANIATYHNGGFNEGNTVSSTQTILPLTDEMTISVTADNINEDGTSNISITLSNPNDGVKTELVGSSLTITVTETWADTLSGAIDEKGELWYNGSKLTPNGDGTYTIPLDAGYVMGSQITGLEYKPAENRNGNVTFEVSVQNKETGSSVILDSKGSTNISVTPVIDVELNASVVTATGTEDDEVTVGSTTLANPVKLEITAGTFTDGSEKVGNIILDEVPNGFTVWYKVGSDLVMATNIGKSGTGTFDLTPNISGDADVLRNKWLIPASADGSMPEVYINAPTNWAGDFKFKAQFTLKEQNLTTTEKTVVDVIGKITPVADGVTIDPTLTFGKAFEWIDLKLNANMEDVDGSETMSLELSGLGANAQFRINGTDTLVSAEYSSGKWTITGIAFDQINNIQFTNDKAVDNVGVKAWTVEAGMLPTDTGAKSSEVNSTFNLDIKDVGGILSLEEKVNLDFSKLSTDLLKGLNTINLSITGENKLENLKLDDILKMTNDSGELTIKGLGEDKVSFKNETGNTWSKAVGTGDNAGFYIYTNSGNSDIKVKVEQAITDGITS